MELKEVLKELEQYGDTNTKRTLMNHGAKEPLFGVKVADLKKILKKTKKNHELSLGLYATGNSDAMYLAGLMADENKISKTELEIWAKNAYWSYLNEWTVPWVASETDFGFELGMKWINSNDEQLKTVGWGTLAAITSVIDDKELDIEAFSKLLDRVEKEIHTAENRVRMVMNRFVIYVGTYLKDLTSKSMEIADRIGKVEVDMNGTACKVPSAKEYIKKSIDAGKLGVKRKSARC